MFALTDDVSSMSFHETTHVALRCEEGTSNHGNLRDQIMLRRLRQGDENDQDSDK